MAFEIPPLIKEHPFITAGVVLGVIGAVFVVSSIKGAQGAPSAVSGGPTSADYQAALAAQTQLQGQQNQLAALGQQYASQLAIAQSNNATSITNTNTAAGVANNLNTDQTQVATLQSNNNLLGLINNNETSVSLAGLNEQMQTTINGQNTAVLTNESNNNLALGVVQSNNYAAVSINQSNNALQGQEANAAGNVLSSLFHLF